MPDRPVQAPARSAWREARATVIVMALVSGLVLLALHARAFLDMRMQAIQAQVAAARAVAPAEVVFVVRAGRIGTVVRGGAFEPIAAWHLFEGLGGALVPTLIGALSFTGLLVLLRDSRLNEGSLRRLLGATPFALAVVRLADREIVDVNDALAGFLGVGGRAEAMAALRDLLSGNDALLQLCQRPALEPAEPRAVEHALRTSAGANRQVLISVGHTILAGYDVAILSFADIDVRHRAELALREAMSLSEAASRAKSEFLTVLSHELRTPLHAMVGLLAQLDAAQAGAQAARRAHLRLRQAADTMAMLLDDMSDSAVLGQVDVRLEQAPFDWHDTIVGAASLASAAARDHGMRVTVAIDGDRSRQLVGDAGRLRQIVSNLVGNAIRHGGQGQVSVRATMRADVGARTAALEVLVEDEGPGFSEQALAQRFGRYAAAGRTAGMGLGLSICKWLADAMCARLEVGNLRLRGAWARFAIVLPLCLDAAAAKAGPSEHAQPISILLVEDVQTSREVAAALLRADGHRVTAASDLPAANAALDAGGRFDVVLCDLRLPGGHGAALARGRMLEASVDEADRHARMAQLIALTANPVRLEAGPLRLQGFDAVIAKPFDPRRLAPIVAQVQAERAAVDAELDEARDGLLRLCARLGDNASVAMRAFVELAERTQPDLVDRVALLGASPAGDRLRCAAAAGAVELLHRLSGAGATLGLARFAEACCRLEACCSEAAQPAAPADAFVRVSEAAAWLAPRYRATCRLVRAALARAAG